MRNLLLLSSLLLGLSSSAQVVFDESHYDVDFLAFKTHLHAAVLAQDTTLLLPLLADSVMESYSYGLISQSDLLALYWTREPQDMWDELQHCIRMGFMRSHGDLGPSFIGPSYQSTVDYWDEILVCASGVRVRAQPASNAKVIDVVSFSSHPSECGYAGQYHMASDGTEWVGICLSDEKVGYVRLDLTSMAFNKRFEVEKVDGEWKLTAIYVMRGC